jgi:hypothetical protein
MHQGCLMERIRGFWYVPTRFTKARGNKRPIGIMTDALTLGKKHSIGGVAEKIRVGSAHRTGIVSVRTHSMEGTAIGSSDMERNGDSGIGEDHCG